MPVVVDTPSSLEAEEEGLDSKERGGEGRRGEANANIV